MEENIENTSTSCNNLQLALKNSDISDDEVYEEDSTDVDEKESILRVKYINKYNTEVVDVQESKSTVQNSEVVEKPLEESETGEFDLEPEVLKRVIKYIKWINGESDDEDETGIPSSTELASNTQNVQTTVPETKKNTFSCKVCSRSFGFHSQLKQHETRHSKIKRHKCPEPGCNKRYKYQSGVHKHRKLHVSGAGTLKKKRNQKTYEKVKRQQLEHFDLICYFCSKEFAFGSGLMQHISSVHCKLKPYFCPKCRKSYGSKFRLTKHFKSCQNETS